MALKVFSRRSCPSSGHRLTRNVRRREKCGGRLFINGVLALAMALSAHAMHGPQASMDFLGRRARGAPYDTLAWDEFLVYPRVFFARYVHQVEFPFAMYWIPCPFCH
jgi:hypothetical protein